MSRKVNNYLCATHEQTSIRICAPRAITILNVLRIRSWKPAHAAMPQFSHQPKCSPVAKSSLTALGLGIAGPKLGPFENGGRNVPTSSGTGENVQLCRLQHHGVIERWRSPKNKSTDKPSKKHREGSDLAGPTSARQPRVATASLTGLPRPCSGGQRNDTNIRGLPYRRAEVALTPFTNPR